MHASILTAASPAHAPAALVPGLRDAVHGAQAVFRGVLDAMAHPGRIVDLGGMLAAPPPQPLCEAAAALLVSLADAETPVWLASESRSASAYLRFHCGSPIAALPAASAFALADLADLPALDTFDFGSDEYPDRSTTLILQVPRLEPAGGPVLRGPGIERCARLDLGAGSADFWRRRAALRPLFPRGLDIVFACGSRIAALPRSTIVEL